MILWKFFATIILWRTSIVLAGIGTSFNSTNFIRHRQKRSLIFENGGTIKLNIGPSMPVELGDPITWRSAVVSFTLQGGQYTIPTEPLYPWDKWEDTFARKMRDQFDRQGSHPEDDSRLFVYTALESYMTRANGNGDGRSCLLRSICENAQVDQHVGVFAEVLSIILTPGNEKLDPVYKEALEAGKSGADCLLLYHKCPLGANILDHYLDEL